MSGTLPHSHEMTMRSEQVNLRLTPEDKAILADLQQHYGQAQSSVFILL